MNSSVGCKILMALTGLAMVGFLIAHLSGNLLVFKGPEALNAYAKMLKDYSGVLWVLRIGLIASFCLHIYSAIRLTRLNRRSSAYTYKVSSYKKSTLVSRTMMLTGMTLLFFVLYHLAHLTFRFTHPEFESFGEFDVYKMLIVSFKSPLLSFFYIISVAFLMGHLVHGLQSFWRTLGLRNKKYDDLLSTGSLWLGVILALGFISIPVSIFFELIQ